MKFMVTGALGQLGRVTVEELQARGVEVVGTDIPELSVEDLPALQAFFEGYRPSHVLHCGAITNVDGCETDRDLAMRVNGQGTANVAEMCKDFDSALVYVSTDFVFDGSGTRPYHHEDAPSPVSVYGESKLAGETAVLSHGRPDFYVTRTAWVFGPGGENFPKAIMNRAKQGLPMSVVDDQVGCPSMTRDLAPAMVDLVLSGADGGVYHMANEGSCSWYEFACDILTRAGIEVPVATMSSSELDRPAKRPSYSILDCTRLTEVRGGPLPTYQDALDRYLEEELA